MRYRSHTGRGSRIRGAREHEHQSQQSRYPSKARSKYREGGEFGIYGFLGGGIESLTPKCVWVPALPLFCVFSAVCARTQLSSAHPFYGPPYHHHVHTPLFSRASYTHFQVLTYSLSRRSQENSGLNRRSARAAPVHQRQGLHARAQHDRLYPGCRGLCRVFSGVPPKTPNPNPKHYAGRCACGAAGSAVSRSAPPPRTNLWLWALASGW